MRIGIGLGLGFIQHSGGAPAEPTAPSAVSNLAAARGDQQAVLTWSAPSSGGSAITDYVVEYKLSSEPTTWTTFSDGTSASTGATVTGLTNGSAYDFRVKAVNAVGTGNASNTASATPAAVPSAIVLTATPGDTQAVLSHSAPAANGSAITDYVYEYKLDSEPATWTTWSDGTSTTPGATITGLTNDVAYDFRAFAINGVGTSAASNIETQTPAAASGTAPTITNSGYTFTNANGDSGQWYRNFAAISGQSGPSYTGSAGADEGYAITQKVAGVESNVIVVEKPLPAPTTITFDVANDIKLSAYPGAPFTMLGGDTTNQDRYFIENNKGLASLIVPSGSPSRLPIAVQDAGLYHYISVPQINGNTGNIVVSGVDASNYMLLRADNQGAGSFTVLPYIAGSTSIPLETQKFTIAGSLSAGSTIRLEKKGDQLRVAVNGVYYQGAGNGVPAVPDDDFYIQIPTELQNGEYVGLLGYNNFYALWDAMEYGTLSGAITIATHEFLPELGGLKLRLNVVADPGVLNSAVYLLVDDATGLSIEPWTSVAGAPGAPGGEAQIDINIAPELRGKTLRVYLSDSTGYSQTTGEVIYIPNYDTVETLYIGSQSAGVVSFGNSDLFRDRAHQGGWIWRGGASNNLDCTLNDNGYPIGPIPSGSYGIAIKLWEGGAQKEGLRAGAFRAEIINGTASAINVYGLSNVTTSAATSTGVTLTLNMVEAAPNNYFQAYVEYSVTSLPADGFQVTCLPVGDTGAPGDILAPQAAAVWNASLLPKMPWRDMKDTGVEVDVGLQLKTSKAAKPEFAVDFINKTGCETYYHNISWSDMTYRAETTARPWIEAFRDGTTTQQLCIEVSNEVWNDFYLRLMLSNAAAAAAVPGCWEPGLFPEGTVVQYAFDKVNWWSDLPDGGQTSATFEPGDVFTCMSKYAKLLVECIAATTVPVGTDVPTGGENAYFRVLAGSAPLVTAGRRHLSHLQKQASILGKSIMGDRCKSVLGIFLLDTVNTVCDLLEFDDAYLHIDHFSPSFYAGGKILYADTPWAALYASDFPAFKAAYYALRRSTCDAMIAKLVALKHGVPEEMVSRGHNIADIPTMGHLYEGLDHNVIGNIPDEHRAGVMAAIDACHKSEQEGIETAYMFNQLKEKVGGTIYTFADVSPLIYNGSAANGQLQQWGLRTVQYDGAWNSNGDDELRYNAAIAVMAA